MPKTGYKVLDSKVIVVAAEGYADDWSCYIGAVEGKKHEEEWHTVKKHGTKLPKEVAEILFPAFKHLEWRP